MYLFYQKKYMLIFFILLAFGFVVLLPLTRKENIATLILILWVFILGFVFEYFSRQFFKQLQNVLTNDCDPEKFIDIFNHNVSTRKLPEKNSIRLLLGLSTAIIESGNYDKSLQLLESIAKYKEMLNKIDTLLLYNNLAATYGIENDKQNSNKYFNLFKSTFDTVENGLSEKSRKLYENMILLSTCMKDIGEGKTNGVADKIISLYDNSSSELQRVHYKYNLGKAYVELCESDNAKAAFDYVIQHGNKLFVARLAKIEAESLVKL